MSNALAHRWPIKVSFGPAMPGWGSWEWLGADTSAELGRYFQTSTFSWGELPDCDVVVVIKHLLPAAAMASLASRAAIIYCPVDFYSDVEAVKRDAASLQLCSTIVVHCERLRPLFDGYAAVDYVDHHVKYVSETILPHRKEGHVLWVGVRTNMAPLVEWVNASKFDEPLLILSNFENSGHPPRALEIGFRSGRVATEQWTPESHRRALRGAKAALDIKGTDFRQSHKPATKALDFLASGIPLAMNASSSVEHLDRMGFEVVSPLDAKRWFSQEYWRETATFGSAVRELLTLYRIGVRWRRLILDALSRRRPQGRPRAYAPVMHHSSALSARAPGSSNIP